MVATAKTLERQARRVQNLRARGLCTRCSSPKNRKGPRCAGCIAKDREKYHARVARGECVYCGERATAGAFCLHHWFKNIGAAHGLRKSNGGIALLKQIWEEQGGCCAVTGRVLTPGNDASLDHVVPSSKGGTNERGNLRWVLWVVNRAKSDMTHQQFVTMCREVVLAEEARGKSMQQVQDTRSN